MREKCGSRSARYSARRVLAQVPGVVGLLGAGRGEGQPVGRRDVAQRRGGREALQQPAGLGDVLDRLQEDDRVARPVELLHQPALEAQVCEPVAQSGVLVGLRVCVHPHHLGRPSERGPRPRNPRRRRDRRPAALLPAPRSIRRRRDDAGTSSSPRGHPGAFARRSAPAAGLRGVGSVGPGSIPIGACRRWKECGTVVAAGCLVARPHYSPRMPPSPSTTAAQIKHANVRYHDAAAAEYDSKWGIDFGPIGQGQVRAKVAKALGGWPARPFPEALEIGSGTGYFSLNLLQLGLVERLVATDISPGMLDELGATARAPGARRGDRGDRRRAPAVRGPKLRPRLRTCGTASPARSDCRARPSSGGCCGPAARWPSAVSRRATGTSSPRCRSTAPSWWRRCGGCCSRLRRAGADPAERLDGHELELEVDVHAFAPGTLAAMLRDAGFANVRIRGEELLANAYGWTVRTLEGTAEPEQVPDRWRRARLPQLPGAPAPRRRAARAATPGVAVLQPRPERQAGCLEVHPAISHPRPGKPSTTRLRRQRRP